jgi:hypothetical protein
MNCKLPARTPAALLVVLVLSRPSVAQGLVIKFAINWDKVVRTSQTTPTLQVVVNPPLRRGTPVHDNAFPSLHDLGGRLCPLGAVAALSEARRCGTGAPQGGQDVLGFHRD